MRLWVAVIVLIALGTVFFAVTHWSGPPNGRMDAAGALAVIGGAAVAIERAIEAFWTLMAKWKSSWWPLSAIAREVNDIVAGTESAVAATFEDAATALKQVGDAERITQETLRSATTELSQLKSDYKKRMTALRTLSPDNQRVQLIATSSLQAIAQVEKRYLAYAPQLERRLGVANQVITGLADFTASLTDNPGKRLWSIVIGAHLGLAAAGILSLDVFAATGTSPAEVADQQLQVLGLSIGLPYGWFPFLGVALTGLIIGLGSNPTHEVIAFLKEAKKDRRASTQLTPDDTAANTQSPQTPQIPAAAHPRGIVRSDSARLVDDMVSLGFMADDQRSQVIEVLDSSQGAVASEAALNAIPSPPPRYIALRRRT